MILILENNENNENKTIHIECLTANGSEKKKVMGQSLDSRDSEINRKCIQSKWNVSKW